MLDRNTFMETLRSVAEIRRMQAAYGKLLAGDASVIGAISESWLRSIAEIAVSYAAQGANLEDVIQEGNMGLLMKLYELVGAGEVPAMDAVLEGAVSAAMIAYTEENMEAHVADMVVKEQEKKNDSI